MNNKIHLIILLILFYTVVANNNVSAQFQTNFPTLTLKYDIDLELDHFIVSNVRDLDGTEDLWGSLFFRSLSANSILLFAPSTDLNLWDKALKDANTDNYRNGTYPVDSWYSSTHNGQPLIKNLTLDQLKNVEIKIGGCIIDAEILARTGIYFTCASCDEVETNLSVICPHSIRRIRFNLIPATQASISNLRYTGGYQVLNGDTDIYFELRFWESGKKENGYLRTMWKVWVKPHY